VTETAPSPLDRRDLRARVSLALTGFLDRQEELLRRISPDLTEPAAALREFLDGGKRMRPAFCYWGWRAGGGQDCPEIYTAAAALELLQASALVHDDVMDASDTRRGGPAVHRQFASRFAAGQLGPSWQAGSTAGQAGPSAQPGSAEQFGLGAAILIGDMLLAWTDELYHASGFAADVLSRGQPALNAMRTEVAAGQYLDLLSQVSHSTSVRAALRVVTYKTAKYTIERPLQLGVALAAGPQSASTVATLDGMCTEYGIPLGIAFQLRDDILGVFGDPARTGKPVSGDISEGKRTVLMALARDRASAGQARVLDRYLGDRRLTEAAAAQVTAVLTDTGAVAECEALIAAGVK
jgi:geranylgeranyl diphosphate synthase, type I